MGNLQQTLIEKYMEIIEAKFGNINVKKLAEHIKVPRSTLWTILNNATMGMDVKSSILIKLERVGFFESDKNNPIMKDINLKNKDEEDE